MITTVPETGSTNADLIADIRAGVKYSDGFWLRAERQTGGRGRQGRVWRSPIGNLYCSTVVNLRDDDHPAATLSLVAGLAVHDLLRTQLIDGHTRRPNEQRWLKWPNDILINGAKLAGILCERVGETVVVGIGVNVAEAPEVPDRPTTCIHIENGRNADTAQRVLESLIDPFRQRLSQWRNEPLSATIVEWEERAHAIGSPMIVSDDNERIRGAFDGLGSDGSLRIRLEDGELRSIHAGDISLI